MAEDQWSSTAHPKINEELLSRLKATIEDESALIVEHRHYRGGSAPDRIVFDDPDALAEYFAANVRPGDAVYIWKTETVCTESQMLAYAKMPNEAGDVPVKGAY